MSHMPYYMTNIECDECGGDVDSTRGDPGVVKECRKCGDTYINLEYENAEGTLVKEHKCFRGRGVAKFVVPSENSPGSHWVQYHSAPEEEPTKWLQEMLKLFNETEGLDIKESYITFWNEEEYKLMAVVGKMPKSFKEIYCSESSEGNRYIPEGFEPHVPF